MWNEYSPLKMICVLDILKMKRVAQKPKSNQTMLSTVKLLIERADDWNHPISMNNLNWLGRTSNICEGKDNITCYDYCMSKLESISADDAHELMCACLRFHGTVPQIKNIELYLMKKYDLKITKESIQLTLDTRRYTQGRRVLYRRMEMTTIIKYIYTYGYIPKWDDLMYSNKPKWQKINILGRILNNQDFTWVDMIIANDNTMTAERVVSKDFVSNCSLSLNDRWKSETDRNFYAYILEKLYTPPVPINGLIKMACSGIPYRCFRNLAKKSKLNDTDFYELFDSVQTRDYIEDDADIIIDFAKYIHKNEKIIENTIQWLCKQTKTIKYVRSVHKKSKCKFSQAHLEAAMKNIKSNFALIQFILQNSERNETKITKKVIQNAMDQQKPPRIFCLLLDYLE